MTYRTKFLTLSVLLGLLTIGATLGIVFSGASVAQRQASESLIPGLEAFQVTGLEFPGKVVLTKAATWSMTVDGAPIPASDERIDAWLKTLAGAKKDRLVGRSVNLADFGLDNPRRVAVQTAGKRTELLVGNPNGDGAKVFVKHFDSAEVWEVNRDFSRVLDVGFNNWADLSLVSGKKGSDLARATYTGTLETSDKTVYAAFDVQKGAGEKFTTWSNQVATFRFASYFVPGDGAIVDGSAGTLNLEWGDGTSTVVKLGQKDAQNNVAASEGGRQFWINEWALGQVLYKP